MDGSLTNCVIPTVQWDAIKFPGVSMGCFPGVAMGCFPGVAKGCFPGVAMGCFLEIEIKPSSLN